jgi:predicted transcriptional regulator
MKGALISVQPRFSKSILDGVKTAELRRRAPACEPGDVVVVYETSPTMAIVGIAIVSHVQSSTARNLWPQVRHSAQITEREYYDYFAGKNEACAIHLTEARHLKHPISLKEARDLAPDFQPPQSWCYLKNLPKKLMQKIQRASRA